jgi:hypothetical protein
MMAMEYKREDSVDFPASGNATMAIAAGLLPPVLARIKTLRQSLFEPTP